MKHLLTLLISTFAGMLVSAALAQSHEMDADRARNLVVLDEAGVASLKLETTTADERSFEQVFFAVGRVEVIPGARAMVSSIKAGRVLELKVAPSDMVEAGAQLGKIETVDRMGNVGTEVLTAPIGGLVLSVRVSQGEAFRPATTLIEIADLREVDVVARVFEHEASLLQPGSSARIQVLSACDKILKGTLVRFGTEGDRKHGTVEAYYRLTNPDLLMRPGMRAEFRIIASEREVPTLPRDAVQGNAAGPYVFVKDYELPHAFVRVPVVTGQRNDRFVEIVRGLLPGDEVVTRGAYALSAAGRGTVSLREALDAAHGHPHDEEGNPISGEDHGAQAEGAGHSHAAHSPGVQTPLTIFFGVLSVLTLGLLWLSRRHPPQAQA